MLVGRLEVTQVGRMGDEMAGMSVASSEDDLAVMLVDARAA